VVATNQINMLNFKTLYGDVLIFKNTNDCVTICRGDGGAFVKSIEIDGEYLDYEDCDYDLMSHPKNTFTEEEIKPFIDNYNKIVGDRY